jgi:DNA-binding NarL/FixJ family response regulator
MIRILLVDDHPATRAGLHTVLRLEPGLVPVGEAANEAQVWPLIKSTRPDVVLLDYHLPGDDGLVLCHRIKSALPPPQVILYSAYAGASLTIPAKVAGADGLVNKGTPARDLFDAIRRVAGGDKVLPPISRELLDEASRSVEPDDLPILGMLLDDTPPAEIARTVQIEPKEVAQRVRRLIGRLKVDVPAVSS